MREEALEYEDTTNTVPLEGETVTLLMIQPCQKYHTLFLGGDKQLYIIHS